MANNYKRWLCEESLNPSPPPPPPPPPLPATHFNGSLNLEASLHSLLSFAWTLNRPTNQLRQNSPGHILNWIYDFLSSDWFMQNQNIAQTAKGLRPRENGGDGMFESRSKDTHDTIESFRSIDLSYSEMISVSFSLFLYLSFFFCYFMLLFIFTKIISSLLFYFIYLLFFMKIILFFHFPGCSGMFRNVPACSRMFRVPGFNDARFHP